MKNFKYMKKFLDSIERSGMKKGTSIHKSVSSTQKDF